MDQTEYPLKSLVDGWHKLIGRSLKHKARVFQDDADDCMRFFNGHKDDFWGQDFAKSPRGYIDQGAAVMPCPEFQMVLMKVAEMVQLFGPALYATNPTSVIEPKQYPEVPPEVLGINPQDPMGAMQYQALMGQHNQSVLIKSTAGKVLEKIINYYQRELNKKTHARRIVDEALITGLGCGWTELYYPENGGPPMVGTFYDPCSRLAKDPDAEVEEEVMWKARKRRMSARKCAHRYEGDEEEFRRHCKFESVTSQAISDDEENGNWNRKTGQSNDVMEYWELYSKMGMGDRIPGVPKGIRGAFEKFGDYCYLAICKDVPYPLNLHPGRTKKFSADELLKFTDWPIPFYDDNSWPVSELSFHRVPGQVWPMSHATPGLGELKWLTWAYSFLASKVRSSCGTMIACLKEAGDDIVKAMREGHDNKIAMLETILDKNIGDIVQFIQQPPFHGDIWKVVAAVQEKLDERWGTAEVLYGMGTGHDRSAAESRIKNDNAGARIADMRTCTEEWLEEVNTKEALATIWMNEPDHVLPIVGPAGAAVFRDHLKTIPLDQVSREYTFNVLPGSTARKTKQAQLDDMLAVTERMSGPAQQLAVNGMPQPWNAMVEDLCDAMGMAPEKYRRYLVQPPPPPDPSQDPAVIAEQQKQQTEAMKAQAEFAKQQLEAEIKKGEHQMALETHRAEMIAKAFELEIKQREADAKLQFEQQKMAIHAEETRAKMQAEAAQAGQKMQIEAIQGANSVRIEEAKAAAGIAQQQQAADAKLVQGQMESTAKLEQQKEQSKANVAATKAQAKAKASAKPKDKKK